MSRYKIAIANFTERQFEIVDLKALEEKDQVKSLRSTVHPSQVG